MHNLRNAKLSGFLVKLASSFLALFASFSLFAQSNSIGILSGNLVDAEYGGGVYNATLTLVELNRSTQGDLEGRFYMGGLPDGVCTLVVTAPYYKAARVTEVIITSGEITKLDIPMYNDSSDVIQLDEFVVTAKVLENSTLGLISSRQRANAVSDAISSETLSRHGLSDAADAMVKVPGVSILDGRYAVVRGLSDRYNTTTMNGATVPSADPDKRAVQLDQFPSGIIDSITTVKTFTPDKSGSFTGGYVDIKTKSVPDRFFFTVSAGIGYNSKTTGKDMLTYDGGGDDWLGKDDGTRQIPLLAADAEQMPRSHFGLSESEKDGLVAMTQSFDMQMEGKHESAPLDHSLSFSFGNRFNLSKENPNGPAIGVIGSVSYKRGYDYYDDGQVTRYEWSGGDTINVIKDFREEKGVQTAELGSVFNIAFLPNDSHEIGLNTTYNQSGNDEVIFRTGLNEETVGQDTFNIRNIHYTERTLGMKQLYGKHRIEAWSNAQIEWSLSDSKSAQQEPDFRLFYDTTPFNPERGRPVFTGNFPAPRRYWRRMDETNDEYKLDVTIPFAEKLSEIRFGIQNVETNREFVERGLIYRDARRLPYNGDVSNFLEENFTSLDANRNVQRYILDAPGTVPEYYGIQEVDAAYVMAELRAFEKWRFIIGVREEDTKILVQSFDSRGRPKGDDGDLSASDTLPALNVVYELSDKMNARFAYTNTLARPNFRELSPFGSFDNVGGENFVGNPLLERTLIDNIDLRYEWFIEGDNLFTVTAFHKEMENPIELNFVRGELTYVNVDDAEVSGLEIEARRKLNFISSERSVFTLGGNLSVIETEVQRSPSEIDQKDNRDPNVSAFRELQGQSSFIGNLDLDYENYSTGTSASLVYNHTGERLYSVTLAALPDIFDAPSNSLDLIVSQKLGAKMKLKLKVSNLLDDSSKKFLPIGGTENVYSKYEDGISVSLGFTYHFE